MRYAFIDECGSTALFRPEDPVLALAAVVTDSPRRLELIARRAMRRLPQPRPEIKASQISRGLLEWILSAVASEPLAIACVCVDKRSATRRLRDPEEMYRLAAGRLVYACVSDSPELSITLDRRYTRGRLSDELDLALRLAASAARLTISYQDSLKRKELQIADCVAWAVAQRRRCGDDRIFQLIAEKVVFEETIALP
ncbi:MAG: DUF3800 domain-containing protein [Anaerolineae bacterium]|jgi:hypothetical protein|nr:DUF3800 domain-containing protein [Anaerolineae bacterium]